MQLGESSSPVHRLYTAFLVGLLHSPDMPPKKRSKKKAVVEANEGSKKESGLSTSQALDEEPPGAKWHKVIASLIIIVCLLFTPQLMPLRVSNSILL